MLTPPPPPEQPIIVPYNCFSPFKFRLPLIFSPFNFRPFNFRHPLLKISLPSIFATLWEFELLSISINLFEIEQQAKYLFVVVT